MHEQKKMTELYTLLYNAAYRTIPASSLGYSSVLYATDTIETATPVLMVKEFNSLPALKFATSINIGMVPTVSVNVPTQLTCTTLPADANAGIVWKVLKGDSYATITPDGMITVMKDTTIDVEAYAVTTKGATVVKTSVKLNKPTGLVDNVINPGAIRLYPFHKMEISIFRFPET